MGKVAGAALTAAAPEAKLATAAAGASKSKASGGGTPAKPSQAQRQRQQIDAIKARRPADPPAGDESAAPPQVTSPAPPPPGAGPSLPAYMTNQSGSPSWWGMPNPQATANTGSGFLFGIFAWALGLAYLRGGSTEMKRLLAAKFLNKTGG